MKHKNLNVMIKTEYIIRKGKNYFKITMEINGIIQILYYFFFIYKFCRNEKYLKH